MTQAVPPEHPTTAGPARAPTLLEQLGGVGGLVSSVVPVVIFVAVNPLIGLQPAIWASLGAAVAVGVWRLVRREPLQPAVSGILGVAFCAFIAYRTGEARGFFLYGIWYSLVAGLAAWGVYALLAAWRRPNWWPYVGSTALAVSITGPSYLADGISAVALICLHVVVGVVLILGFMRFVPRPERGAGPAVGHPQYRS